MSSLGSALDNIKSIENILERFRVSIAFAEHLPKELRKSTLEDLTLPTAREIEDPGMKSRALLLLHLDLDEPLKTRVLRESLESALEIRDGPEQKEILSLIGRQLSRIKEKKVGRQAWMDDLMLVVRAGDVSLENASTRRFIQETARKRGQLLGDIAPKLEENEIPFYFDLASHLPDNAGRAYALTGLAPRLSEEVRQDAFRIALEATKKVRLPQSRSFLIRRMGPELPREMLPEALEITLDLPPNLRARTLSVIGPRLDVGRLEYALERTSRGMEEAPRSSFRSNSEALRSPASDPVRSALSSWLTTVSPGVPKVKLPDIRDNAIGSAISPDASGMNREVPPPLPTEPRSLTLESLATWDIQPPRVVSTGFSAFEDPEIPLASDRPLPGGNWYYFWLEVGEPVPGAIDQEQVSIPSELLPPDAELRVVLFTNEQGFEFDPQARTGVLRLKGTDSSVEVVRPAAIPPELSSGEPILHRRLFFSIRIPHAEGRYQFRCNIYYRQVLVQARRVEVTVRDADTIIPEALLTILDYTLSRSLVGSHLQEIQEHRLSVMMNADGDGSHGLYFHGEGDFNRSARFDGHLVQDLIGRARKALRMISWDHEDEWNPEKDKYRYEDASPDLSRFFHDLHRLAVAGYLNYDAIANQLAGGSQEADQLAALMRRPGRLQLALRESARLVLPVALLYDHPLDTQLPAERALLCPEFKKSWTAPLEEQICFLGDCPHYGETNVVCPSGFWGFRHSLGVPLTIGSDRQSPPDIPGELPYKDFPDVAIAVCTDKQMQERLSHVSDLKVLIPAQWLHYADTRESTLEGMRTANPHVVYFYCHGGRKSGIPFIQVGPLSDDGIDRSTLRSKKIRWSGPRPLVFINGCHTTDLEPENAFELVSGFVETSGAAGVIGTEITIFEPLAVTFGEHFLRRFLIRSMPLGDAIRSARLQLLKRQLNPLGLVYIPFGLASLHLKNAGTQTEGGR